MMMMMKKMVIIVMIMVNLVGCSYGRCMVPEEYCNAIEGKKCCEGLTCEGWLSAVGTGYCKPYSNCQSQLGGECYSGYTKLHGCCYPNHCSAPREGGPATGVCLAPNSNDINNVAAEISNDHEDHHHLPTATY
ncbi:hypothetical protein CsatA_005674 [Cannabis sativa]